MKVAIATRDYSQVSGHAGQSRHWLLYDCRGGAALPAPVRVELERDQVFHVFEDQQSHPLDGVEIVVAGSAGDGFLRHMAKRGAQVVLTGESDPAQAMEKLLAGEVLPDQRFDPTRVLCRLRDLFSRY